MAEQQTARTIFKKTRESKGQHPEICTLFKTLAVHGNRVSTLSPSPTNHTEKTKKIVNTAPGRPLFTQQQQTRKRQTSENLLQTNPTPGNELISERWCVRRPNLRLQLHSLTSQMNDNTEILMQTLTLHIAHCIVSKCCGNSHQVFFLLN